MCCVFHRPGRGFEPGATELLDQPAVLEIDGATGSLIASWGAQTFLVPHGITRSIRRQRLADRCRAAAGVQVLARWPAAPDARASRSRELGRDPFQSTDRHCDPDDGAFYVSDGYVNSRVALFDGRGRFLQEWGKKGPADGQFSNPHGTRARQDRCEVLVADRENSRIASVRPARRLQAANGSARRTRHNRAGVQPWRSTQTASFYVGIRRADYDHARQTGVLKLDRDWKIVASVGFGIAGRSGLQRRPRPGDRPRRLDLCRRNAHQARRQASTAWQPASRILVRTVTWPWLRALPAPPSSRWP